MTKFSLLTIAAVTFLFTTLNSQTFSPVSTGMDNVSYSAVQWGDFDNDGDLDVILTGRNNAEERITMLYVNNEGDYSPLSIGLIPVDDSFVSFGDYDNDNDLDLLLTGSSMDGPVSVIYENIGSNVFSDIEAGLTGVENGKSAWGDYDNDGDLDIMITGNWDAILYENDEGTFIETNNDFGYLNSGCTAWGDYDNDGDLDLLINGDSGAGTTTKIFTNHNGVFTEAVLDLAGSMAGKSGFVDYDNDGDLDVYISGFDDALEPIFKIYKNEGGGVLVEELVWVTGVSLTGLDWGDYDTDGDLDLVITGKGAGCGLYVANIYKYENGQFTDAGANLMPLTRGSAQWGDYDNDGDLDILMSGSQEGVSARTLLYRNSANSNEFEPNTPPDIPTGLAANVIDNSVEFSWDIGNDEQTIFLSLNYNLRIGRHEDESEIMAPMADPESGYRTIIAAGNTGQNTSWTVNNLVPGTYYWSVQTIDQAYAGSEFAEVQSFTVTATNVNEMPAGEKPGITPNPASENIEIIGLEQPSEIHIYDASGNTVYFGSYLHGEQISVKQFLQGLYFITLNNNGETIKLKFLKR